MNCQLFCGKVGRRNAVQPPDIGFKDKTLKTRFKRDDLRIFEICFPRPCFPFTLPVMSKHSTQYTSSGI